MKAERIALIDKRKLKRDLAERLWEKVDRSGDCWIWTAARNGYGYGMFYLNGRTVPAQRVSWELTNGPWPANMHACHTCDNPPCVRPDHIFPGTNADNIADCNAKGRRGPYRTGKCRKGHVLEVVGVVKAGSGVRCAQCRRDSRKRRRNDAA